MRGDKRDPAQHRLFSQTAWVQILILIPACLRTLSLNLSVLKMELIEVPTILGHREDSLVNVVMLWIENKDSSGC